MALILTLCCLVLLTGVILAFFSRAILDHQIAYSSVSLTKCDFLAHSALDIIVGEVRNEIADPNYSSLVVGNPSNSVYPTMYLPLTPTSALPQKVGIVGADAIGTATLLKISAAGSGIRPGGPAYLQASSTPINASSFNGHFISSARWFGTSGPQLGTQTTMPTWVLLSRSNGILASPSVADAQNPSSPNFIIGRFAYTVYDLSGQVDANTAGYLSSISANTVGFKSSSTYDDLTSIGLNSADVSALIGWRNGYSATDAPTFDEWATGMERNGGGFNEAAILAARSGHLSVAQGDNAFLSRNDLIQAAAHTSVTGISQASLGYVTHFSRSLNQPSWMPSTNAGGNYNYQTNAENTLSVNRDLANVRYGTPGTVTHYDDDGNIQTYTVSAGDPLIQRRFSLAKIAWLQTKEQNSSVTTNDAAIQSSFGLQWDAADERWNYVGPTGSTGQSSIETLAQVAAESTPREPNFFEMLKAGILSGSLGMSVAPGAYNGTLSEDTVYNPGAVAVDSNTDLQILRIGASTIDSAETDNYPTILALQFNSLPFEVAGIADLPYLYGFNINSFFTTTAATATPPSQVTNADYVLVPIFLNPHRGSVSSATSGPAKVQLVISSGTLLNAYFAGPVPGPNNTTITDFYSMEQPAAPVDLTAETPIVIPSSQFNQFRQAPQPQTQTGAANSLAKMVSYFSDSSNTVGNQLGYSLMSFETAASNGIGPGPFPFAIPSSSNSSGVTLSGLTFSLQYQTRKGDYKTYATFGGYEALPSSTGLSSIGFGSDVRNGSQTTFSNSYFIAGVDPRTNRMGPGLGWTRSYLGPTIPATVSTGGGYTHIQDCIGQQIGFLMNGYQSFLAYWPQGGKSQTVTYPGTGGIPSQPVLANTLDPDENANGTLRPNDGWLGTTANPYLQTASGHALNITTESRPVILHRPYRSVAELGYVFRDTQWKSLSFFDQTSPDSALLDLFSISDRGSMIAGLINLNTSQVPVLTSILNNTGQNSDGSNPIPSISTLVSALKAFSFSSGVPSSSMPINLGQFPNFMSSTQINSSHLDTIKYHREAVVRAIGQTTQTRTWNLLIDVVAQVGRYPQVAKTLSDFRVEGEKRYWLSIAIDRYSDKIIDEQLEPADE